MYQRLNRRKDAEASYRKAMALAPDLAEPYNALGSLKASTGKAKEAEQFYRQALEKNPAQLAARHNLALLLSGEKRLPEAIDLWRDNLKRDPGYLPSRLSLAAALPDPKQSIEEYRAILSARPDYLAARLAVVDLLEKSGDAAGAVQELQQALKIDDKNAAIYERIGDLEAKANHPAESRAAMNRRCRESGFGGGEADSEEIGSVAGIRFGYCGPAACTDLKGGMIAPHTTRTAALRSDSIATRALPAAFRIRSLPGRTPRTPPRSKWSKPGSAVGSKNRTLYGIAVPRAIPAIPPARLMRIASARNCNRTSLRDAPTAIRTPISRVRSVTVTSMMFMIPMPEIISAIADTRISTSCRMTPISSAVFRMAVRFSTWYLAPGRWRLSRICRTTTRRRLDVLRLLHLHVQRIDPLDVGEVAQHGHRNQDRFLGDLGLPEALDLLAERADHREPQSVDLEQLSDRAGLAAIEAQRQLLGQQRDAAAHLHIARVERPPGQQHQIPHALVVLIRADDLHVLLFAGDQDAIGIAHHAGDRDDPPPQFRAHRVDVPLLDEIRLGFALRLAAGLEVGVDHVRADAPDLLEDIVLTGLGNGDDQDDRGIPDHHAKAGEKRADRVRSKSLNAEPQRLAKIHPGLAARLLQ